MKLRNWMLGALALSALSASSLSYADACIKACKRSYGNQTRQTLACSTGCLSYYTELMNEVGTWRRYNGDRPVPNRDFNWMREAALRDCLSRRPPEYVRTHRWACKKAHQVTRR